ncbi:MAG TPA: hypothetical protein GX497_12465 [Bacillus bacterium]|nr:hypothetical protein [Bacillus sp. (in: firmicutes)]
MIAVKSQGKDVEQLLLRIKEMEQKLVTMTDAIESLKDCPKVEYNVYIEKIDVHSLTLEELNFSLENIDVNELSGAMNIGNTFSPSVAQKESLLKDEKKGEEKVNGKNIKEEIIKKLSKMKEKSKQQPKATQQEIKVIVNGKEVSHKVTD